MDFTPLPVKRAVGAGRYTGALPGAGLRLAARWLEERAAAEEKDCLG
jgi:hypothetical protein